MTHCMRWGAEGEADEAAAVADSLTENVALTGVSPEAHMAAGLHLLTMLCDLAARLPSLCHVLDVRRLPAPLTHPQLCSEHAVQCSRKSRCGKDGCNACYFTEPHRRENGCLEPFYSCVISLPAWKLHVLKHIFREVWRITSKPALHCSNRLSRRHACNSIILRQTSR